MTDADGVPVIAAAVRIRAFHETCGGPERWLFNADRRNEAPVVEGTDATGGFGTRARSPAGPGLACMRLEVTPPATSGLAPGVVEGATVHFDADHPRASRAVVTIDVVLEPAEAPSGW